MHSELTSNLPALLMIIIAIIAAFQARLNENADNIVDALISLRFSVGYIPQWHAEQDSRFLVVQRNNIWLCCAIFL